MRDGEGPVSVDEARHNVSKWIDKPEHKQPKPGKAEPKEDRLEEGEVE